MKRFLLALALVAVAGATYVATAPGGQTAGPTAAQFRALKSQVAKLQKDERKVKKLALLDSGLLLDCMTHSVPINQFGDNTEGSTLGYSYTNPSYNSGAPFLTTALDVTSSDDSGALWMTGGTSKCGDDLNAALRKLSRLSGIDVSGAALHSFSAHRR